MCKINWNQLWHDMKDAKGKSDNREFWDEFAPKFRKKREEKDPYIETFYEYMKPEPGDTLFDMGCASGTLAIPYALKGHEIFAADFSSEMLKYLMEGAKKEGVADKIHPIKLDWNEEWSARELPKCDIAFSSRSFICRDLTSSLKKLESVAKCKVCIGAWDNPNSDYDRSVAEAIGYERPGLSCYYFIMGELMDRDMKPELKFINSPFRLDKYESREEATDKIRSSFINGLTQNQEQEFERYMKEHLIYHKEIGMYMGKELDGYWTLDHDNMSSVAFISYAV